MASSPIPFTYATEVREERVGDTVFRIEALKSLEGTIDELFAALERAGQPELLEELCPYFGVIWPAARALAAYLAKMPHAELASKRFLEVGCGLAFPSLVAARAGAQVTAMDIHPEVPRFLARNLALNGIEPLRFVPGDWRSSSDLAGSGLGPEERFDWVVGSDILYEKDFPAAVARAMTRKLAPEGKLVLADPGRPYLQAFADEMKNMGFACETEAMENAFILVFDPTRSRS